MTLKITQQNLRTPGPIPVPQDMVEAMSQPMINHRGPEFRQIILEVTQDLKQVFMTQNDLLILTASGTGSLEASIVNTLSPGDKVLSASVGAFGNRFADIAETYGAKVQRLEFEWGEAVEPEVVRDALKKDQDIEAVLVTHNETSTGVTSDLQAISKVVKGEFDKLLLVDAVSSLGCLPLPTDAWNCDTVGTASQKGFFIPPGLAFVSVSKAAWQARQSAKMPRFYFDLEEAKKYLERGQTPFTPAVSLLYGLAAALKKMLGEGMENVFKRHARLGQLTRNGVKELGLRLFVKDERDASNAVTAIKVPEGVSDSKLLGLLRTEENVVLAGGQGKLTGKVFRIGHLGSATEEDIKEVLVALKKVLPKVGFRAG